MSSAGLAGVRRVASLGVLCAALALTVMVLDPGPARAADPTPAPVRLPPIVELTVGSQHACVIVEGGEVWCWGFATEGALGAGADVTSTDTPVQAALPRPAVAIDAGFEGTCAITDDGAAWCWGANDRGQVGDGTTVSRFVPTRVGGLDRPVRSIARGHDHACAVLADGSAWCWGDNLVSELGTRRLEGSRDAEPEPVRVPDVPALAEISAGAGFTCGIARDGAAWCWGTDLFDEVGRGDGSDSYVPGRVTGLAGGVERLDAGDNRACAIRDGSLLCWGLMHPDRREAAPADAIDAVPTRVELGAAKVVDVAVSNGYHVCALDRDGITWCWGDAEAGQLGPGVPDATPWVAAPVRLDLPAATAVATGYDFTCALLGPDDLRCWGNGDPVARNPWTGETGPATGGFREPGPLVPTLTTYIPTPRDISTDPPVVGANLLLAALVMILFTVAGELLNRTLAESEDALAARGGVLAGLRRARSRLDGAMARLLGSGRLLTAARLAGIAAIYGLVFSLLDRTWDPLSVTGVWLFLSMAVAFGIVGIADDLACWSAARRWGVAADLDLRPGNLLVALTSTFASRVAVLVPGVMIGMPEALDVEIDALDARRRARLAAVGLGTLAVLGSVAWAISLATSLAGSGGDEGAAALLGGVEAFCLVVFAVTVQNGFAQLLAFRGTPGHTLRRSHRWTWLLGLLVVSFLFWHTLVNPRGDLAGALGTTNVVAFMATAGAFVVVAVGVWLVVEVRRRRTTPLPAAEPAHDVAAGTPVAGTAAEPEHDAAATVVPVPGTATAAASPATAGPTLVLATAATPPPPAAGTVGSPGAGSASVPLVAGPAPVSSVAGSASVPLVAHPAPEAHAAIPGWRAPGARGASSPPGAAGPPGVTPPSGAAGPPGPIGVTADRATTSGDPGAAPAGVAFDLRAVADPRLGRSVRLTLRPDGVGLTGSWIRARADRISRAVDGLILGLFVLGFVGIALLTTVPGFRFYQVPWLLPACGVALIVLAGIEVITRLWRASRRWSGEVLVPTAALVGVRASLDRSRLVLACLIPPVIGGVLYAALVGPTIVRLRGTFDPERATAVEVRLRCRDRDEAADIVARIRAIQGFASTGGRG